MVFQFGVVRIIRSTELPIHQEVVSVPAQMLENKGSIRGLGAGVKGVPLWDYRLRDDMDICHLYSWP